MIELNDYDKHIQQFVETLSLPNNDNESMIAKYRSKIKEDETRNVNNWNKHFDKLKETHSEEQNSNETDNLLKSPQLIETVKFTVITKKTTIATTTDHATIIHEEFRFIKCTTHPR